MRPTLPITSFALLAGLPASTLLAAPTILDVGPRDAFVVLHIPSLADARDTWQGSSLREFSTDPAIAGWVDSILSENAEGLVNLLDAWEELTEEIDPPTGSLGLASALRPIDGGQASVDVGMVDWGDAAEDAEDELVEWLEAQEDDGDLTLRDERFGDLNMWIVEPVEGDDDDDMDWDDDALDAVTDELNMPWDNGVTTYIVRVDGVLLASSDRDALETGVESLEGRDREVLADEPMIGEAIGWMPDGSTVQVAVLAGPLLQVGSEDSAGLLPEQDALNIADALGATEVEWLGIGVSIDPDDGLARISGHLRLDERRGIFSLLDAGGRAVEASPLVSGDSSLMSRALVNFDQMLPLAQQVVAAFPAAERAEAEMGLMQTSAFIAPVLAAIGPEVDVVVDISLPHGIDSQQQVVAIAVKDRDVVANTLGFGAGFVGATPQDFLGAQVFEADGFPAAAGITDAWLIIGSGDSVRSAIRRLDGDNQADFELAPLQTRAPARASIFGAEKLDRVVGQSLWSITSWEEATRASIESLGMDWLDPAEMIEAQRESSELLAKNAPKPRDLLRHVDEVTFWVAPSADGFDLEYFWHVPQD